MYVFMKSPVFKKEEYYGLSIHHPTHSLCTQLDMGKASNLYKQSSFPSQN